MPNEHPTPFKVAVVQAAPVFLDRTATIEKACELIACAGREGARLIVFPEAFIPTYPDWVWAIPPGEMQLLGELYAELLTQAVTIPSDTTERLCHAARRASAYVVMGINERNVEASGGSLYDTLLYIDDQGQIMGKHRKLTPTAGERLVWAQGDGSTLQLWLSWEHPSCSEKQHVMLANPSDVTMFPGSVKQDTVRAELEARLDSHAC